MLVKDTLVEVYPFDIQNMDADSIGDIPKVFARGSGKYFVEAESYSLIHQSAKSPWNSAAPEF